MSEAVELVRSTQAKGAACIWIRNAVDDAIAAVAALRDVGVEADLLHARFAVCDRLDKEAALQRRFGKIGTAEDRQGRVLVATQVAGQSLDPDFDVMVSDLAPIGAMIQRAGRLWRHQRASRPVDGPCLHVLSPDPTKVERERWLHQVLNSGAYVYDPTVTWRSAVALFAAGEIKAPDGSRTLIEAVEGDQPLSLPEALQDAEASHIGNEMIEGGMARNVLICSMQAFDQDAMAQVFDDEQYPTHLGVPQVTLTLATRTSDGLRPLQEDDIDPWALFEVQVSAKRFEGIILP
jgi:CRISPR-associated endonuclease/helicase Cas3